jgi:hypothetical protein
MSPYQRCPFCETVVEIGSDRQNALRRHIRAEHTDNRPAHDRAA